MMARLLEAIRALPPTQRRIGNFVASVVRPRSTQARFDAKTNGFGAGQQAKWQLNGTGLGGPSGQVDLGGGSTAKYELVGTSVILSLNANKAQFAVAEAHDLPFGEGTLDNFSPVLERGDVVTITANPSRTPNDHKLHMLTLHRKSDGFGWGTRPGEVTD